MPYFARTDFRVSWRPRGSRGRWEYYLEVINVLNRENAITISPELRYDSTSDRPRIVEDTSDNLHRFPTIGVRWRF